MSKDIEILYLLSHTPDNRYRKRFSALNVFEQYVVYWDKTGESPLVNLPIKSEAIPIRADRTNPLKRLPETVQFLYEALKRINELKPKIIYVGNLDMLHIAYKYKRKHPDVKIVYEVADLHRLVVDKQKGIRAIVRALLRKAELNYSRYVNLLILTSMKFYEVYYKELFSDKQVIYLPNMPIVDSFANYDSKKEHKNFTVGFFGWIRYIDQLNMLIDASSIADVNVIFAGADNTGSDFRLRCSKYNNVDYRGPFDYEREIASLYEEIDCIYSVYNADLFNVRVALPNKLYEAVYCEKPIIVAKNTYLAELVEESGVGLSVSHNDFNELAEALIQLKMDKSIISEMKANCKLMKDAVFEKSYNEAFLQNIKTILGDE